MEELAKLEAQRGNPEYLEAGPGEAGYGRGSLKGRAAGRREGAVRGRRASNEMCNFLILNISSLQLIPVNMIAYRSQYGSANPTAIIAPAIAATLVSTLIAIVYCKIKDHTGIRNAQAQVQEKSYKALSAEGKDRGGKAV